MDEKNQLILLGELKAFRAATDKRLHSIDKKIDSLNNFKIRVTLIMALIVGCIELFTAWLKQ